MKKKMNQKRFQAYVSICVQRLAEAGYSTSQSAPHAYLAELIRQVRPDMPIMGKRDTILAFVGNADADAEMAKRRILRNAKKAMKHVKEDFLLSKPWLTLRYEVIKERGARCECCGVIPSRSNGVIIQVDHVKPRSKFPELALDKSNMQVLCKDCNLGKSNTDQTDWRESKVETEAEAVTEPKRDLRYRHPKVTKIA